jgi:hypothetical protein
VDPAIAEDASVITRSLNAQPGVSGYIKIGHAAGSGTVFIGGGPEYRRRHYF